MLEVIYRIYEVADEETAAKNREKDLGFGLFSSTSKVENTIFDKKDFTEIFSRRYI